MKLAVNYNQLTRSSQITLAVSAAEIFAAQQIGDQEVAAAVENAVREEAMVSDKLFAFYKCAKALEEHSKK